MVWLASAGAAISLDLCEPHDILRGEASHFRCQSAWLHLANASHITSDTAAVEMRSWI